MFHLNVLILTLILFPFTVNSDFQNSHFSSSMKETVLRDNQRKFIGVFIFKEIVVLGVEGVIFELSLMVDHDWNVP